MSVFDENRSKCRHCGDYVNHWDWVENEFHDTKICVIDKAANDAKYEVLLIKLNNLQGQLATTQFKYDYLLDLDYTLADI